MQINIPILAHSYYDLSKFDFSFKDIYIVDIQSDEFKNYISSLQAGSDFSDHYTFVEDIIKEIYFDYQKYYAIIKKDARTNYDYREINNVYKILLIIFPSDLQILHELHFDESEGIINSGGMSSWNERITGDYPGKYMLSHANYLDEINDFIKVVFDRLKQDNYIGLSIYHYLISFDTSHLHYQYLSLFMVLESAISETSELTYRLRRNTAVLVGESEFTSNTIYTNIGKLYNLRSKIIHGDDYDYQKLIQYTPYLQAMASRTIIELLLHNYPKNKELNHKITQLGFGDKAKISSSYKSYTLNILTYVENIKTEI